MQMAGVTLISSLTYSKPFFSVINSIEKEIINAQPSILFNLILGGVC